MKILVVGSGAREHALAWRFAKDGAEVHVAPGNGGTARAFKNHAVAATDVAAQVGLAEELAVDLVVVGPEAPLVLGLVDALVDKGIAAFGPSKAAAQLEGSKIFAKECMRAAGVPTAAFEVFDDFAAAEAYLREADRPLVVKADGLAAGKGVTVASDADEAVQAAREALVGRKFGDAGARILIEECFKGPEVSYHVVSDGERYVSLAAAQDHKRAFDGDKGPNTGGMGAYSPPPMVTAEIDARIRSEVVEPTLTQMGSAGTPFRGALFVGLMIVDGAPKVLEYNVRFGDPETECLMTRLGGSAVDLFLGSARGDLSGYEATWEAPASLCVVLASGGYPGAYSKGVEIEGVEGAAVAPGVQLFHAGTVADEDALRTSGGRVLCVTAVGDSVEHAASRAYVAADRVQFEGRMLRRDIGWQAREE